MSERRKDKRYSRELEFSIAGSPDEILTAQSVNISSRGLLCTIGHEIAAMSKLKVTMDLPFADGHKERLQCDGVVVRCEAEGEGIYRVAIYFLQIPPEESKKIYDYLGSSCS